MLSRRHLSSTRLMLLVAVGVFATLAFGQVSVGAQTTSGGSVPATPTPSDTNCAVSTARIGGLDVTEFFGVRGGATGFAQNFGAPPTQASPGGPSQTLVQRCIRLEVENPAPGDLVPAGGYTMGGFAFDPTISPGQGSGISNVQVFLDDPNQGGAVIGGTTASSVAGVTGFGLPSERAAAFGDQFANSGFHMTVQIPFSAVGTPHAMFVVALSSAGRVGTVAVPIIIGNLSPAVPTRTP
jgi:hypothetical protein